MNVRYKLTLRCLFYRMRPACRPELDMVPRTLDPRISTCQRCAAAWPGTCSASASPAGSVGAAGCDAAACHSGDTRYGARRYYAHDATLRYANAVAACGAAAPLQLGAFGHSLSSSRPPGAVVVDVCSEFSSAHRAARALSRSRFRCRSRSGGMLRL